MYKRHKWYAVIVVIGAFLLSYIVHANYSDLASDAMTLVSITIAVYITVPSFMVGSSYADKLKKTADTQKTGVSELGTLKDYLMDSMLFSILTIVISSLYSLKLINFGKIYNDKVDLDRLFSSFSCAMFALNILFLWLIFKLTLVTMLNAATYDNEGKIKEESTVERS